MNYVLKGKVYGRVQGVGFRAFAKNIADEFGLYGYVKNLDDGSVGFEAIGSKEMLNLFLEKLKKGPPNAFVLNVEYKLEVIEDEDLPKNFNIVY